MSKRRRAKTGAAGEAVTDFWGPASETATKAALIGPTSDPGALPRSLGAPPLSARSGVALASLTTVYEEAVRTATALAAANGLLAMPGSEAAGDDAGS
jgi:hypothetical protein